MVLAVLDDLHQHFGFHVGERDLLVATASRAARGTALVLDTTDHGLDEIGHEGDIAFDLEAVALRRHKRDVSGVGGVGLFGTTLHMDMDTDRSRELASQHTSTMGNRVSLGAPVGVGVLQKQENEPTTTHQFSFAHLERD